MRAFALVAGAALWVGTAAQAGSLVSATWSQSVQGIAIEVTGADTNSDGVTDVGSGSCIDTLPNRVQTTITCPSGLVGTAGSATATTYNVSLTMPFFALNTFTTGGPINRNSMASFAGSATISGNLASAAANDGIAGMYTQKVAVHVAKGVNASMLAAGKTTLVKLPISVGGVDQLVVSYMLTPNIPYITVDFYGWTPHTVSFTGLTSKFAPLPTPTIAAMGSVNLNAAGGGVVTLVAPSKISIDGPLAQRRSASLTTLRLVFAPEPAVVLLLLPAGAAGLALSYAHRKRRTR